MITEIYAQCIHLRFDVHVALPCAQQGMEWCFPTACPQKTHRHHRSNSTKILAYCVESV